MSRKINIDELLSAFVDGELSERRQTEVKRLIKHDERVARRLAQIEKHRALVAGLGVEAAPAGLVEQIKSRLEHGVSVPVESADFDAEAGAKHLLMRKVVSAAAIVALAAGLGIVVLNIVSPSKQSPRPVGVDAWVADAGREKPQSPEVKIATAEANTETVEASTAEAVENLKFCLRAKRTGREP